MSQRKKKTKNEQKKLGTKVKRTEKESKKDMSRDLGENARRSGPKEESAFSLESKGQRRNTAKRWPKFGLKKKTQKDTSCNNKEREKRQANKQ